MRSDCLAVIPARGGSKGVPHKNLQLLAGKPLIAHVIGQARQARSVGRLLVSTDDREIAAAARSCGAEVVERPAEISGDTASSESALLHVLGHLEQTEGYKPDLLVFLQCTSPLTLAEDIDRTVETLLNDDADSALAVTPFHYFLWRRDESADAVGVNHDKQTRLLRQERDPQFLETGAVYVMRTAGFRKARHRFFGRTAMYVMPPERCLEIDDVADLRIAEVLLREQHRREAWQRLPQPTAAVVLDFDGVFTDNRIIVLQDGREAVICDRGDGMGLSQIKKLGVPVLVLSTETNRVVGARCSKLGIACQHGVEDKLAALKEWLDERGIDASAVVYVGNDVNDLACLKAVGCGVAVADAVAEAKRAAQIVLSAPGGRGAIRELAELIGRSAELPR